MKKFFLALISLVLILSLLSSCVNSNTEDHNNSNENKNENIPPESSTPTVTNAPNPESSKNDPSADNAPDGDPSPFENKTVFSTDNFILDSKMTKYFFAYLFNVYFQNYGYYISEDVLIEQAELMLLQAEAARAKGHSVTEADIAEINEAVNEHEQALLSSGYSSLSDFYGEGVDAEAIKNILKLQYLSNKIVSEKNAEIYNAAASDKEKLEEYYDSHPELLFGTYFAVRIEDESFFSRLSAAKSRSELEFIANEYSESAGVSAETFSGEQMLNYPSLSEGESLSSFEKWFFSSEREKGDIYSDLESKTVFLVILPAKKRSETLKSAGHILITPENSSEDARKAAQSTAEALLAEFLEGEKTQDSFEAIAKVNTEDGNVFYDEIYIGQMVEPFNDWVYDPQRQQGDTGIVETEYGFHIMYFVGDGELKNYEYMALPYVIQEMFLDWTEILAERYPVTIDADALAKAISFDQ